MGSWINGVKTNVISISDRGLHYGDGVFETMVLRHDKLQYWPQHYQRLSRGCAVLDIACPPADTLLAEIMACIESDQTTIVKLIITRGPGSRGYEVRGDEKPQRIVIQCAWPDNTHALSGIRLHLCQTRLAHQPHLAGLKHLNRLEQVLARHEWSGRQYAEGLMLDAQGDVIEGTMSNIFCSPDGKRLLTPCLDKMGVSGIQRALVIQAAHALKIDIQECQIALPDLLNSQECFVCNRVIGLWPVKQLLDTHYPVGAITQMIQQYLADDEASN